MNNHFVFNEDNIYEIFKIKIGTNMNKLNISVLFISGVLFAGSSFANGNYDLKCTLDSGEDMTVSHSSDTIYIAFGKSGTDSEEEGEDIIKLDVPSGEVIQKPGLKTVRAFDYLLYGTNAEMPVIAQVEYNKNPYGEKMYFATKDKKSQKVEKTNCIPSTIKIANTVTQNGIVFDYGSFAGRDGNDNNAIKLNVTSGVTKFAQQTYNRYYWKYTVIAQRDGVKVLEFNVNRGNCDVSLEGMNKPLNFSNTVAFTVTTNRDYTKCIPQEAVVKTNFGTHSFNFNQ
ncbi:TPA: hypothetical protein LVL12_000463 [Klebsiella oxytoca]|nr:hypothetical protein [Klebsiella oxytoca]